MGALFATICIVALNQTIIATAIPTISSQLKSASGYAWIGGAYRLDFGGATFSWRSPIVIGLIVAGGCIGGFFLWSEKSLAKYPLMPLGVFRSRSNVACLLIAFFHDFVYIAVEYYFPLFFQSVLSASPLRSGILLLPIVIMEAVTGILTGLTVHRTGAYRPLIYAGTALLVIGTSLYTTLSTTSSIASLVGFQIIAGLGTGMLFSPPLLALQANVNQENTATATSTMGFVKNLSTCLSVVLGGVVFQNGMKHHAEGLINAGLDSNITSMLTGNQAAVNVMLIGTIEDPIKQAVVKQAFAGSIRYIWIVCAVMAGCAVVCSAFVKTMVLSEVHVETRTGLYRDQKQGEDVGR